jgi:hypothetical protein
LCWLQLQLAWKLKLLDRILQKISTDTAVPANRYAAICTFAEVSPCRADRAMLLVSLLTLVSGRILVSC